MNKMFFRLKKMILNPSQKDLIFLGIFSALIILLVFFVLWKISQPKTELKTEIAKENKKVITKTPSPINKKKIAIPTEKYSPSPTIKKYATVVPTARVYPSSTPTPIPSPTNTPQATTGSVAVRILSSETGSPVPYATFSIYLDDNNIVGGWQVDSNGYKKVDNIKPGNHRIYSQWGSSNVFTSFSLQAGQEVSVNVTLSTTILSPTPTPDTVAPILDAVNGPFDWGDKGICFTINGDQVHDGSPSPLLYSWRLDAEEWSGFVTNDVIKCYQNLSSGSHLVSARAQDVSGNTSQTILKTFTK